MTTAPSDRLILASASPRRSDLLRAAGYRFVVRPSRVSEDPLAGERAADTARRLALEKALDVARRARSGRVLGADTVVTIDGITLGKPADDGDAARMLRILSGRTHRVITGVALCPAGGGRRGARSGIAVTHVGFRSLSRREIEWYVRTGEPMGKAGAYAIQGAASLLITGIRGSWSNVVGLPLDLVRGWLGLPP